MLLQVCVNGSRRRADHPALAVTPSAIAAEVAGGARAGATAAHVHVKDEEGVDTLDPARADETLVAVRAAVPGLPIGLTTGAWAEPDPAARVAAVRAWRVRPDFASVNWHETGAEEVAGALLDVGVGVEAGLWHVGGAEAWLASPLRDRCVRVLVELPGDLDAAGAERAAGDLLTVIGAALDRRDAVALPVLLHGEDSSTWPALRMAARLGLDARIGLEDTLLLPDGHLAADNRELVTTARAIIDDAR